MLIMEIVKKNNNNKNYCPHSDKVNCVTTIR